MIVALFYLCSVYLRAFGPFFFLVLPSFFHVSLIFFFFVVIYFHLLLISFCVYSRYFLCSYHCNYAKHVKVKSLLKYKLQLHIKILRYSSTTLPVLSMSQITSLYFVQLISTDLQLFFILLSFKFYARIKSGLMHQNYNTGYCICPCISLY